VIAGRPQQAVYAGGDDRQPLAGLFWFTAFFISERELLSPVRLSVVCRPSSVVCLSVTFVRPTQAVQIFGNISTALATLAIR